MRCTCSSATRRALGAAVALDGDVALVSAPRTGAVSDASSAVFVFERRGGQWLESARLVLGNGGAALGVGENVALRGRRALVGAAGDSEHGDASGAVLELVAGGEPRAWRGPRKLGAPGASEHMRFGAALALDERAAVIGAPGADRETGAVYWLDVRERAPRGE